MTTVPYVTLLLIEDDKVDRLRVERKLKQTRTLFHLFYAVDGDRGLSLLQKEPVDCILLDYHLPKADGATILQQIRNTGIDTPIVMLTGEGDEQIAVEIMKSGASDYLIKSNFTGEQLERSILGAIRTYKIQVAHQKTRMALQESEARYRAIFETLQDIYIQIDLAGNILDISPSSLQHTGHTPSELKGTTLQALCVYETQYHHLLTTLYQSGLINDAEVELRDKQGKQRTYSINARLLRDASGIPTAAEGFMRDISERKEAAKRLQERNEELDAFASTVAHDLKGSLHPIIGLSEYLEEAYGHILDEDGLAIVNAIHEGGKKMADIIQSLLLLARVRHENPPLVPLNTHLIVAEALARTTQLYEGANVTSTIAANEWPVAFGYAAWVEEIWVNYISNAIKYGGTPPYVELGADKSLSRIRFWVRDNGLGIPADKQDKLFTPFTRLHKGKMEGHGLGLSIVQRIVNKLGGEVGVESRLNSGSTFWFTLPTAPT